ncbi:diguanylate cyclase [Rhodoferax sp. GW822-FHT02A01]|uniref:sensor domain-containing diguanylate cyclase n=1 Tax=Rhodoferax sp. GW822-FHT02A01 TaxID=3141537 RepID=UPI00315D00E0
MKVQQDNRAIARTLLRQLPWLVLVVMLAVTWFTWGHERQSTRKALRFQFDFALRESVSRIEQRVQGYEQMLRGVQSLFATTSWNNRTAMHNYVDALQLDANFSGVQTIGMIDWSPHKTKVQLDDDWSDPVRREAMERARDSGIAAISGNVQLKTQGNLASPGFIMYLPVYASGMPHESLQQRRDHLVGWVYAAFQMSDFMASLYGSQSPGLMVAIYDGTDVRDSALLYQSDNGNANGDGPSAETLQSIEYMVLAGHNWTLLLRSKDSFESNFGRSMATGIAVGGAILGLVMALLAWQLIHGREMALRFASSMTEELRHMAQHDPLTGLPNRALFNDRLHQELARAKRQNGRFAMVFLDLDQFKPINDNYGHAIGDQILKEVAKRLQKCVRAADTVGRIGGDEFVVLLAHLSETDHVLELADKFRLALKAPFMVNGQPLALSCSVGVAVYPDNGTDAIALVKNADEAMYRAKDAGRDCVKQT